MKGRFSVFKVGDLVVYGNTGVCTVEQIGASELAGADRDKQYYYLTPYYSDNGRIMIPCDNQRIVLRPVISKKEADELIRDIEDIEAVVVESEKTREITYKNIIKGCDCREIISLLKCIYSRKMERISEGKKSTSNDEKYFNIAEDKLYGELAISLGIDKKEVKEYIRSRVELPE